MTDDRERFDPALGSPGEDTGAGGAQAGDGDTGGRRGGDEANLAQDQPLDPNRDVRLDPKDRAAFQGTDGATGEDGVKPEWPQDAGAYIGHEPERATETIPGGVGRDHERVAAGDTQGTGVGRPDVRGQPADEPEGHRFTGSGTDTLREAGQNR